MAKRCTFARFLHLLREKWTIIEKEFVYLHAKETTTIMAASILNKIEYLVLLVAAFAAQSKISEAEAYRYLSRYGALALCEKHYGIMHTLSLEENLQTLQAYCQKKGGTL
jgi:hypothetical protein